MKTQSCLAGILALLILFFSSQQAGKAAPKNPAPKAPAKQPAVPSKYKMEIVPKPPACPPGVCVNQESTVTFHIHLLHDKVIVNDKVEVKNHLYEIDSGGGLITCIEGFKGFEQIPPHLPQTKVCLKKPG